jgi:hypothetical protein
MPPLPQPARSRSFAISRVIRRAAEPASVEEAPVRARKASNATAGSEAEDSPALVAAHTEV